MTPEIVAVADKNEQAPGFLKAKGKGIFVTNNYNDLFNAFPLASRKT